MMNASEQGDHILQVKEGGTVHQQEFFSLLPRQIRISSWQMKQGCRNHQATEGGIELYKYILKTVYYKCIYITSYFY